MLLPTYFMYSYANGKCDTGFVGYFSHQMTEVWKKCFVDKIHHFLRPDPPDFLLGGYAVRIARERSGGRIGSFPPLYITHHSSPCSYIIWGMNNRPVGGRSSGTQSHPFDINK
jgi:hypothetical protein